MEAKLPALAVERITADSELLIAQQRHNTLVAAHRGEGGASTSPRSSGTGSVPEDSAQTTSAGDCLPHEFDNKPCCLHGSLPTSCGARSRFVKS
jgi:hypothetical protein